MAHAAIVLATLLFLSAGAGDARAACNAQTQAIDSFGSVRGAVDRPFASPGEPIELRLRGCDASAGFTGAATDYVVSIAFTPPAGGTPRTLVFAPSCAGIAACRGTSVTCHTVAPDETIRLVTDVDQGDRRLVLFFPNTDADFAPGNDGRPLAGPAAIAVTRAGDPLPCTLATSGCTGQVKALGDGLVACVDRLFEDDGACGTSLPDGTFPGFTAMPIPTRYRANCFREAAPTGPCQVQPSTEVGLAVDVAGNLLAPVVWQGVLLPGDGPLTARLIRGRLELPTAFQIPDDRFLAAFDTAGVRIEPIFEPILDPTAVAPNTVTIFGSVDAPTTVLRVARFHGTCTGGGNDGDRCAALRDCPGGTCARSCVEAPAILCTADTDCPSGPCGALFDLGPAAAAGGPVVLERETPQFCQLPPHSACTGPAGCPGAGDACVSYAFEAEQPAIFECPVATDDLRGFTVRESVDLRDRNGDGDTNDTVVTLRDRTTGTAEALGAATGCGIGGTPDGRAVLELARPPFRYSAIAAEGDVLAFLESEQGANSCIQNGDDDADDAVLRIVRNGAGEVAVGPRRAVDPAPLVDGRSLAVSSGRVILRSSESGMGRRRTELANLAPGGVPASGGNSFPTGITPNGRFVVFESFASNLVAADTNGQTDAFVRDRLTDVTSRVSLGNGGQVTGGGSGGPISADGRFVLFGSSSPGLPNPGDTNAVSHVWMRDRQLNTTTRESISSFGIANGESSPSDISADARFIVFTSDATNLLGTGSGADTNGAPDVYVRDRQLNTISRANLSPSGAQAESATINISGSGRISDDGRFVAFDSSADNLLGDGIDGNDITDVFVRDRVAGTTTRVSVPPGGLGEADGASTDPDISADGRYVAFHSTATNLLGPGEDTNGFRDVFVYDRLTATTTRASVGPGGLEGAGQSALDLSVAISPDGRYVAFASAAANLLGPGEDTNSRLDVFVHDRETGVTTRVSVGPANAEATGSSSINAVIAQDARAVAFDSAAPLVAGDLGLPRDVFVRTTDAADPLAVDALLFPDGVLDDTVLESVDAATGAVTTFCPAGAVAVAGSTVAFLRREQTTSTARCPGTVLNADGDTSDEVVSLIPSGVPPVVNLGLAATALDLSTSTLAALVTEAGNGNTVMNGDGDALDTVVQTQANPPGAEGWRNSGQAADYLVAAGPIVAFATPEAAQAAGSPPSCSLNGDTDCSDRVLQIWTHATSTLRNTNQAVRELVVGERGPTACGTRQLIAFSTPEADQGTDLNGAAGIGQDVLQVFEMSAGTRRNLRRAVSPVRVCDPERPFTVETGGRIRFRTEEADQNADLDGNGVIGGLVEQVYDFCAGVITVLGPVGMASQNPPVVSDDSIAFKSTAGRCALDPTVPCNASVEPDPCPVGSFCSAATGLCTRTAPGTCGPGGECPPASVCIGEPVTFFTSTRDEDADGVPDGVDGCTAAPNTTQPDSDGDGVPDACDAAPLGCTPTPRTDCHRPVSSDAAKLKLTDKPGGTRDGFAWSWARGAETALAAFGDPLTTESFALCLYDADPTPDLDLQAQVPAGGTCRNGKPCWRAKGTKGFSYADPDMTPNGVVKLALQSGIAGKAKVAATAKGASLRLPPLPLALPARVQLQATSGECWEATYEAAGADRNDAAGFKGTGD